MTGVTVASIEEVEPIYAGLARRARATLGVSAWEIQVFTLPPGCDGYPEHNHDETAFDPHQEEVYVPLREAIASITGFAGRPELFTDLGLATQLERQRSA